MLYSGDQLKVGALLRGPTHRAGRARAGLRAPFSPFCSTVHKSDRRPVHKSDRCPVHKSDRRPVHKSDRRPVHKSDRRPVGPSPSPPRAPRRPPSPARVWDTHQKVAPSPRAGAAPPRPPGPWARKKSWARLAPSFRPRPRVLIRVLLNLAFQRGHQSNASVRFKRRLSILSSGF